MSQQPDKFFRDKLETFHKPAPPAAWDKIEAGLQKKDNKAIMLRIAAAILLLTVATFTLWTTLSKPVQRTATKTQVQEHVKPSIKESEPEVIPSQADNQQAPVAKQVIKKNRPAMKTVPSPVTPLIQDPIDEQESITPELAVIIPDAVNTADSSFIETTVADITNEEEEKEESRVLVFSVEEVDAKYLDKEALAKATSGQKKPSTFRKLLNKAYDLKTNQDPFGDLRQKKNEILALNFKSEKRSQNK